MTSAAPGFWARQAVSSARIYSGKLNFPSWTNALRLASLILFIASGIHTVGSGQNGQVAGTADVAAAQTSGDTGLIRIQTGQAAEQHSAEESTQNAQNDNQQSAGSFP